MHRFVAGTCRMVLNIDPAATWIVREAARTPNGFNRESRERPDVRLKDVDNHPLLPGSSINGVLRATAERILSSLHPGRKPELTPLADVLFGLPDERKSELAGMPRAKVADTDLNAWCEANFPDDAFNPWEIYARLSPASQLFGATVHAGLVTIDDARIRLRRLYPAFDT